MIPKKGQKVFYETKYNRGTGVGYVGKVSRKYRDCILSGGLFLTFDEIKCICRDCDKCKYRFYCWTELE